MCANLNLALPLFVLADVPCDGECSYECAVIDGEEQCYCPSGFELSVPGGTQCVGTLVNTLVA